MSLLHADSANCSLGPCHGHKALMRITSSCPRAKSVDSSDEPVNVTDTCGSVGGQDSVPQTPRTPRDVVSDAGDPGQDPGSVSAAIPSPLSPSGPSKAKKK